MVDPVGNQLCRSVLRTAASNVFVFVFEAPLLSLLPSRVEAESVQLCPLRDSTNVNSNQWMATCPLAIDKDLIKKLIYHTEMLILKVPL